MTAATHRLAELLADPEARGGVLSRRWLVARGVSTGTISNWRRAGLLFDLHRGVYLVGQGPPGFRQLVRACHLLVPEGIASHRTAAALHGLLEPRRDGVVDLVCDHQRRSSAPWLDLHRTSPAVLSRRVEHDGLPTTCVADTVVDCCAVLPGTASRELLADALRRGLATRAAVRAVLRERPRLPGTACLEELLDDDAVARLESWLEARGLDLLGRAGLVPEVNARITDGRGRLLARGDLVFREARVVVELDGLRFHATPAEKAADDRRQNALVAAGWTVLRYSWADLRRRPTAFVTQVRHVLARSDVPLRSAR